MLASTLVFFLGTTPALIVVSRAIQGASTSFVWVSGLAFLSSQVGEGDLGEYVGWTTVGVAVGEVVGPLVGGPIYDCIGHWGVFGIVEGLLVVDILLRMFVKEKTNEKNQDSETEGLLRDGEGNSNNYDTLHGRASSGDSPDPSHSVLRSLAWNWLGTVLALIVIFMVRGALEVVSQSTLAIQAAH
jgi:MFS family permease